MDTTHESLLAGRDLGLSRTVVISALVHVLVLGGALYLTSVHHPPLQDTKPIIAHLVRLGPPRDPKLLPRKYYTPPPPKRTIPLPVKRPTHAPPKPKVRPKTTKHSDDPLADAINKIAAQDKHVKPDTPPGSLTGDPEGDAMTAKEGDQYLALVRKHIHDNYQVPSTISDQQRVYLNATVVLYVAPDGHILRTAMEKSSGNQQFDDALRRAVTASDPLPPPPKAWQQKFMTEGLGVKFRL